jgi:hypothetical protein
MDFQQATQPYGVKPPIYTKIHSLERTPHPPILNCARAAFPGRGDGLIVPLDVRLIEIIDPAGVDVSSVEGIDCKKVE